MHDLSWALTFWVWNMFSGLSLCSSTQAASWAGGRPPGHLHLEGPQAWLNSVLSTLLKFLITFERGALHFNFTQVPTSYVAGPGPGHSLRVGFVISSGCSSSQSPLPHPFMPLPLPLHSPHPRPCSSPHRDYSPRHRELSLCQLAAEF